MPVPAGLRFGSGRLAVTPSFTIAVKGYGDARLLGAIDRMSRRLEARTGLTLARGSQSGAGASTLLIQSQSPGKAIPALDEDESYSLEVSSSQATLNAPTVVGALRGLETFLQLLSGDKDGYYIPAVNIQDKPRFPWRGLMIDVGRHWQPMEVIKRNLDGMAAVKLNVLHLHLTEDQGFRIESKKYPKLHQLGSDGNYYTQDQMREIIEYARMRGIRVVPEFDMPGHTTSWFLGHPELASEPGRYQLERRWGIFGPVMDPTNEQLYKLLDGFIGEMAALFPDAYLHIGGDEVEAREWKENPRIQAFIRGKGLKDNHGLQAYFNRRLSQILTKHGKKMVGWDEILHPDLPKDIIVQSWRGQESLAEAAKKGYAGILSNGYYIDLMLPTWRHYLNDPIPENTSLTPEEQKLILGGEATMWSEWVSPETIDSRIWPRTAAIAERFWSPREVKDVDDMYRRLPVVSVQLEDAGLLHKKNPQAMARRLAGSLGGDEFAVEMIMKFLSVVEPVKGYKRGSMQKATQFTPLTRIADAALPDSAAARQLNKATDELLYSEIKDRSGDRGERVTAMLTSWGYAGHSLPRIIEQSPILAEALPLANDLEEISQIGLEAIKYLNQRNAPSDEWRASRLARLEAAAIPRAAVEFAITQPIKELVIAAAEQEKRKTIPAEEWKKHVKSLSAEKKMKH
ncbi:MAG: family 20 glycosylhydrolase [Chloracidobacterium sp.]|nr:family 20 glycosylhydrolase [Chloracidobacterium sp.]